MKLNNYLSKLLYIINYNYLFIFTIFILFIGIALLEIIGLSIITPYLNLILMPENDFQSSTYNYIYNIYPNLSKKDLIWILSFVIILIFFVKFTGTLLTNYFINKYCWNQIVLVRDELTNSYTKLDYITYTSKSSADYIQTLTYLPMSLVGKNLLPTCMIFSQIIIIIFISGFLAYSNFSLFIILAFFMIIMLISYDKYFKKKLKLYGELNQTGTIQMLDNITCLFNGYKEFKILKKFQFFSKNILKQSKLLAKYNIFIVIVQMSPRLVMEFLTVVLIVSIVLFTIIANENPLSLITYLAVFFLAAMKLGPAVSNINSSLTLIRMNNFVMNIIYEELKNSRIQDNIESEEKITFPLNKFKKFELANITFKYPGTNKNIFEKINIEIHKGQIIGIAGESGTGKTTLVDLILGLISPTNGFLAYNDSKLESGNLSKWQSKIGYLPQDYFLFNDTIVKNIIIEDDVKFDKDFFNSVLKKAKLDKLIDNLEDGYDTIIGENGIRLSGGQRQRIAIARAFYHKKEILILDESTNSLDILSEEKIINELKDKNQDTTIILITHRLNTLKVCDKIYYLNEKKISHSGTYHELFEKKKIHLDT